MIEESEESKILSLLNDVEFTKGVLSDGSGYWYEKRFIFGGGKFEIVLDIESKLIYIALIDKSESSHSVCDEHLSYENLLNALMTWNLI